MNIVLKEMIGKERDVKLISRTLLEKVKFYKVEDNQTDELNNVYYISEFQANEAFNKLIEIKDTKEGDTK